MTDKGDAMYVRNDTAVNVSVFDVLVYYQTHLFVKIKQIEDPDIRLLDGSLSHVTSPLASIHMYDFDYCSGKLSVIFYTICKTMASGYPRLSEFRRDTLRF